MSQADGARARSFWRLVNAPLTTDPSAMRWMCGIFLFTYALVAVARHGDSPGYFWSRLIICLYAALGIRLAPGITSRVIRAYTIGAALLLPLEAAWVDGLLGNHIGELAITAVATFCPLVFLQAGRDLVGVVLALVAGHVAILAIVPTPNVPYLAIAVMLGGAMASGAIACVQALVYRGRLAESLGRVEEALGAAKEWRHRYETAILASGQVLYDWDPRADDVQFAGACERMLGYSRDDLAGPLTRWLPLVHPDDLGKFEREVHRITDEKSAFHMRYRVRRRHGDYIIVESNGYFIFDQADEIVRMIGFLTDVTERTRAEEARAEEAATSAALARVGHELISSLEKPVVLERLCHLTAEVLECDFSTTWLWKPEERIVRAGGARRNGTGAVGRDTGAAAAVGSLAPADGAPVRERRRPGGANQPGVPDDRDVARVLRHRRGAVRAHPPR